MIDHYHYYCSHYSKLAKLPSEDLSDFLAASLVSEADDDGVDGVRLDSVSRDRKFYDFGLDGRPARLLFLLLLVNVLQKLTAGQTACAPK